MTPNAVATPLPPFNPKNTGYKWPMKAAKPASAMMLSGRPRNAVRYTGINPLSASPASVMSAAFFPPDLSTLVAPGFPEPTPRGSGSLMTLQVKIAVDKEPRR